MPLSSGAVNEDRLYAFKKGSGLVVGLAEGATCVSSDLPSILPLTRRILRVQDGEIVILSADRIELRRVDDGSLIEREVEISPRDGGGRERAAIPTLCSKRSTSSPRWRGN